MSITLHLPPELETKLAAEASQRGMPLSDFLVSVLSNVDWLRRPCIRCWADFVLALGGGHR